MPGKTSTKPPKKPTKKPTSKPKKGGSDIVQNVSGLAVPFAFLLAKQGLEAMKKKTPASPKKSPKKSAPKPARRGSMAGGACSSCSSPVPVPPVSGGAKARSAELSAKLEKLRSNIDNFLSKY